MEKLIDSVVGQGGFAVCVCDADVTRVDDAAKYFADSKAVIVKLREWLPEYRKTGRFLEKRKWVEDLCSDGRLDVACVRASAMKEDSQSYSNVYKAITLFAGQER